MKRSDAIKIIEDELLNHFGDITHNVGEDVLTLLEKAGMLPPISKNIKIIKINQYKVPAINELTWEPEDVR